ncbi:hypothetical protein H9P43_009508 [Blastocladiella emersonii ATCC 22665]|nr:hypothetical protein H9P43_009508 [Blastocladiella emersonii ATCC 22665]
METSYYRSVAKTLRNSSPFERGKYEDILFHGDDGDDGWTLPHFFGELAKTPEGCRMLCDEGHFSDLCAQLRQWSSLAEEDPVHLKAILWAIGHVGCTKAGIIYLEEIYVIDAVCDVASRCPVLSVRGTAFFALGLVAKTARGRDVLDLHGWECDAEHGFCLPDDLDDLLLLPDWHYKGSEPVIQSAPSDLLDVALLDPVSREILDAVSNVCNHVLINMNLQTLSRLRKQHARHFQSGTLYLHVSTILSNLSYRFSARKIIEGFFDRLDLRNVPRVKPENGSNGAS